MECSCQGELTDDKERDETLSLILNVLTFSSQPSLSFQKYLERVYSECTCEGEGLCEACQIADSYSSPSSNSLDSSGHSSTSLHRSSTTTAALRHRCSFNNLRSESEYGGTVVNKSETLDHFETTSSHSIHDSNNDGKADCDNDEGFEATTTDTPQTVLATTVAGETSQDEDAPEANGEEASSEQEPLLVNAIPAATIPLSTGSDDASAAQHAVINKKNRSHSKTRMKRQIKHHEIRECACASETGEMTTLLDKIYDVSLERIFHICYSPKPAEARKPVVLGPFLEEVRKHRGKNNLGEKTSLFLCAPFSTLKFTPSTSRKTSSSLIGSMRKIFAK